ncbi:hypothetical protein M8J77_025536 [Diaphorina citri]|nr:hypothetical protein M8J77_025536 [Diaphorina citri]
MKKCNYHQKIPKGITERGINNITSEHLTFEVKSNLDSDTDNTHPPSGHKSHSGNNSNEDIGPVSSKYEADLDVNLEEREVPIGDNEEYEDGAHLAKAEWKAEKPRPNKKKKPVTKKPPLKNGGKICDRDKLKKPPSGNAWKVQKNKKHNGRYDFISDNYNYNSDSNHYEIQGHSGKKSDEIHDKWVQACLSGLPDSEWPALPSDLHS